MNPPRTWSDIFLREIQNVGGPQKFLELRIREKKPLLSRILRYARPNGYILEAGCGTGVLSTYLTNSGFQVVAVDIDEGMLDIARRISNEYPRQPLFERKDLLNLDYPPDSFDVTFSHGALEHFSDENIVQILNNELRISRTVIVSMPSNYFREDERMFGDERFLSDTTWERLIRQTTGLIIEKFSFDYHLGWEKITTLVLRRKIFGPAPYLTFVLQKKA